ncbi:DsbA family oxidoreductase [Streptomyces hyaluromycini]|uniref:DsbA family oxidoreductase n=1 Tax=Streptomyces hyaluromycini TaxID=1377993 RepID=A0ABV1XF89_9ACTN
MRVEIWTDISCPWCYVGQARFAKALAAFPHRADVEVTHRSFQLDPRRTRGDAEPIIDVLMKGKGWSRAQALANEDTLSRQCADLGLDYVMGRDHGYTFDMHRLLHFAAERGRRHELLTLLYRANFAEERSVYDDDERLVELAAEAGLDADAARRVLADPSAHADDVRADMREATEIGVTGVPFFVLDRKFAVSGAQRPEVFSQALAQAWESRALSRPA